MASPNTPNSVRSRLQARLGAWELEMQEVHYDDARARDRIRNMYDWLRNETTKQWRVDNPMPPGMLPVFQQADSDFKRILTDWVSNQVEEMKKSFKTSNDEYKMTDEWHKLDTLLGETNNVLPNMAQYRSELNVARAERYRAIRVRQAIQQQEWQEKFLENRRKEDEALEQRRAIRAPVVRPTITPDPHNMEHARSVSSRQVQEAAEQRERENKRAQNASARGSTGSKTPQGTPRAPQRSAVVADVDTDPWADHPRAPQRVVYTEAERRQKIEREREVGIFYKELVGRLRAQLVKERKNIFRDFMRLHQQRQQTGEHTVPINDNYQLTRLSLSEDWIEYVEDFMEQDPERDSPYQQYLRRFVMLYPVFNMEYYLRRADAIMQDLVVQFVNEKTNPAVYRRRQNANRVAWGENELRDAILSYMGRMDDRRHRDVDADPQGRERYVALNREMVWSILDLHLRQDMGMGARMRDDFNLDWNLNVPDLTSSNGRRNVQSTWGQLRNHIDIVALVRDPDGMMSLRSEIDRQLVNMGEGGNRPPAAQPTQSAEPVQLEQPEVVHHPQVRRRNQPQPESVPERVYENVDKDEDDDTQARKYRREEVNVDDGVEDELPAGYAQPQYQSDSDVVSADGGSSNHTIDHTNSPVPQLQFEYSPVTPPNEQAPAAESEDDEDAQGRKYRRTEAHDDADLPAGYAQLQNQSDSESDRDNDHGDDTHAVAQPSRVPIPQYRATARSSRAQARLITELRNIDRALQDMIDRMVQRRGKRRTEQADVAQMSLMRKWILRRRVLWHALYTREWKYYYIGQLWQYNSYLDQDERMALEESDDEDLQREGYFVLEMNSEEEADWEERKREWDDDDDYGDGDDDDNDPGGDSNAQPAQPIQPLGTPRRSTLGRRGLSVEERVRLAEEGRKREEKYDRIVYVISSDDSEDEQDRKRANVTLNSDAANPVTPTYVKPEPSAPAQELPYVGPREDREPSAPLLDLPSSSNATGIFRRPLTTEEKEQQRKREEEVKKQWEAEEEQRKQKAARDDANEAQRQRDRELADTYERDRSARQAQNRQNNKKNKDKEKAQDKPEDTEALLEQVPVKDYDVDGGEVDMARVFWKQWYFRVYLRARADNQDMYDPVSERVNRLRQMFYDTKGRFPAPQTIINMLAEHWPDAFNWNESIFNLRNHFRRLPSMDQVADAAQRAWDGVPPLDGMDALPNVDMPNFQNRPPPDLPGMGAAIRAYADYHLPNMPQMPNMPNLPNMPQMPNMPNLPNMPQMPNMPNVPFGWNNIKSRWRRAMNVLFPVGPPQPKPKPKPAPIGPIAPAAVAPAQPVPAAPAAPAHPGYVAPAEPAQPALPAIQRPAAEKGKSKAKQPPANLPSYLQPVLSSHKEKGKEKKKPRNPNAFDLGNLNVPDVNPAASSSTIIDSTIRNWIPLGRGRGGATSSNARSPRNNHNQPNSNRSVSSDNSGFETDIRQLFFERDPVQVDPDAPAAPPVDLFNPPSLEEPSVSSNQQPLPRAKPAPTTQPAKVKAQSAKAAKASKSTKAPKGKPAIQPLVPPLDMDLVYSTGSDFYKSALSSIMSRSPMLTPASSGITPTSTSNTSFQTANPPVTPSSVARSDMPPPPPVVGRDPITGRPVYAGEPGASELQRNRVHPGLARRQVMAQFRNQLIQREVYRPCNRFRATLRHLDYDSDPDEDWMDVDD